MDVSIPDQARKQLQELFSLGIKLENQWFKIVPKCEEAVKCAPSDSNKYFSKIYGCEKEVKEFLGKEFDKIFDKKGHVATYWEDFEMNITQKLGLTYRELARRSNGKLEKYSEAQLQQMVLNPLIRELSKAPSIIPSISDEIIKTDFLVQDEVEIIADQSGQKPAVDAMVQISKADDTVVACVPIEMKVDMDIKDYSQIACYINKLSTAEDLTEFVMIGVIIDQKQFRMAFSVYCTDKGIPLPIVHISPPTEWRSELSGMIDQTAMLTLACTILTGQLKREKYTEKSYGETSTDNLTNWGKLLMRTPHKLGKPEKQSAYMLSLERKVKEHEEKLAKQEKKIEELVKALDNKQIPKPKRPKRNK